MAGIHAVVARNEPRLLRNLKRLVAIESPSHDKAAVNRAMACAVELAAEFGGRAKWHRQKVYGDVLELRFAPVKKKQILRSAQDDRVRPVMVLGHLDTVWPVGTLAGMPWREKDGKIFGPGVLDMKSGVVMAIEAVAALRELELLDRPVVLLLNSEEEVGSPVSRAITERIARDCSAVFVMEPAQGLAYKTARKGIGNYMLRVEGVASHSGVDFEKGHSAIREMARLIERVSSFTDLTKGLTVNVGTVSGGTQSNVVAAECVAAVDVRIVKASDAARVERMFRALRVADKACTLTVAGGINRPPMERSAGTGRLYKTARKLAAEMGFVLEEAATGGGSDGNFTAAIGVPTLDGMGPVGAGAHAAHEHLVRSSLVERTVLLAGMIGSSE
ncbi:MAG: M20 family metallopeptidase [Bryocella sp.]